MHSATRQGDLFVQQGDLLARLPPSSTAPDPKLQRERLHHHLETARAATRMPWDERRIATVTILFRQMSQNLPAEERDALRAAFATELDRLRASPG